MAHALQEFLDLFGNVPDPRARRGVWHVWHEILFIAISATICGADDPDDIEFWGELNEA